MFQTTMGIPSQFRAITSFRKTKRRKSRRSSALLSAVIPSRRRSSLDSNVEAAVAAAAAASTMTSFGTDWERSGAGRDGNEGAAGRVPRSHSFSYSPLRGGAWQSPEQDAECNPESLILRRVTAGVDWAVHSLVFEFADGSRRGRMLSNAGFDVELRDEYVASRCWIGWIDIDPGDYIVQVRGKNLKYCRFLCYSVSLVLASGREVNFWSSHRDWEGNEFSFRVAQPGLLREVIFTGGNCKKLDIIQTSLHLPVRRELASYLPPSHKERLLFILMVFNRFDANRANNGDNVIGADVWWTVLSLLRGYDVVPFSPTTRANHEEGSNNFGHVTTRPKYRRWSLNEEL